MPCHCRSFALAGPPRGQALGSPVLVIVRRTPALGLLATAAVHLLLLGLFLPSRPPQLPAVGQAPASEAPILWLSLAPPPRPPSPQQQAAQRTPPAPRTAHLPLAAAQERWSPQEARIVPPDTPAASKAAPPAPTAEEWAFASGYALKNAKAYRHTWGQQIRSQMGSAQEGPDQGMVRFLVEIAPDGQLARLETLWSTSAVAERLARQAIESMPRWAATPGGRPLVFERTISFSAFANDDPPIYKDDCLPDPPSFRNPFAWDGGSARTMARAQAAQQQDPQALEDCLRQLPQDSLEAEAARDRQQIERWWGSGKAWR